MTLKREFENYPATPRTPSYSPLLFPSPSPSHLPFHRCQGGRCTASSLRSFSHGNFDQSTSWNLNPKLPPEFPQHSSAWSSSSLGAIGQERGTPLLRRGQHEHYDQQKRSQGSVFRRYNDSPSGHHNVVDIDRICHGTDVRTTVYKPPPYAIKYLLTNGYRLCFAISQIKSIKSVYKLDSIIYANIY